MQKLIRNCKDSESRHIEKEVHQFVFDLCLPEVKFLRGHVLHSVRCCELKIVDDEALCLISIVLKQCQDLPNAFDQVDLD